MSSNPIVDWELPSAINNVECGILELSKRGDLSDVERALIKVARDALGTVWLSAYDRKKAEEFAMTNAAAELAKQSEAQS